jgi:DNA-nicking Smr family endonuclease
LRRRLSPDEQTLWNRVVASVRPLDATVRVELVPETEKAKPPPRPRPSVARPAASPERRAVPGETLDASWDRKLARGLASPDRILDLHGHNLDRAWERLDRALEDAIAAGERLILLVTGKPPTGKDRPVARGAIRAAVGDWLHASRHAASIAAVRAAHRRHGGAGALYIILRRRR